jgi:hypothetical protein
MLTCQPLPTGTAKSVGELQRTSGYLYSRLNPVLAPAGNSPACQRGVLLSLLWPEVSCIPSRKRHAFSGILPLLAAVASWGPRRPMLPALIGGAVPIVCLGTKAAYKKGTLHPKKRHAFSGALPLVATRKPFRQPAKKDTPRWHAGLLGLRGDCCWPLRPSGLRGSFLAGA